MNFIINFPILLEGGNQVQASTEITLNDCRIATFSSYRLRLKGNLAELKNLKQLIEKTQLPITAEISSTGSLIIKDTTDLRQYIQLEIRNITPIQNALETNPDNQKKEKKHPHKLAGRSYEKILLDFFIGFVAPLAKDIAIAVVLKKF